MRTIQVPASSANLGPGFDCLGLALNRYNQFTFEECEQGLVFQGFHEKYENEHNMVYNALLKALDVLGKQISGVSITAQTEIPISRGLGSSAACITAGVVGANFLTGSSLSKEDVFQIASEIEGHPDNIAPAVFGGLTVSSCYGGKFYTQQVEVAKGLVFYALIPDFEVSTAKARAALPATVPHSDAVKNISSVAMLLTALQQGKFEVLPYAFVDILHQPYRKHLVPGFEKIVKTAYKGGAKGAFLSGAGPTIMALVPEGNEEFVATLQPILSHLPNNWTIEKLSLDTQGYLCL